ncbi:AraC family transcriptional regulator [Wukongibacter sp. M2B1]|uniref:AraC family transcriptional regulator n=1 Tax=Wukongibacter sp. M2B1 TaxID=3088895 RepID=UPI003D7B55E6
MREENNFLNIKRGYLKTDFEYFYIKDRVNLEFEPHYHDFNKIIIFISGKVTYLIEGKAYRLKPWDILLVSNNEIHKPIIDSNEVYERIIIWVNPLFLKKHNNTSCDLLTCFQLASSQKRNLIRLDSEHLNTIKYTSSQLNNELKNKEFGSRIVRNSLLLQLVVYLNRLYLQTENVKEENDIEYDQRIEAILKYINENLNQELTIDNLSSKFFVSKYYLMHRFKKQTGYTIHNYILQKRLIMANLQIKRGKPITEVYLECGFGDYSNFIRAFKKMFGLPPKQYYKALKELEKSYMNSNH